MIDRPPIDAEGDVIRGKLGIPKKGQSSQEEIARLRRSHNQPFPALETDFFGVPSSGIAKPSRRQEIGRLVALFLGHGGMAADRRLDA
jgi:hypothetical protein